MMKKEHHIDGLRRYVKIIEYDLMFSLRSQWPCCCFEAESSLYVRPLSNQLTRPSVADNTYLLGCEGNTKGNLLLVNATSHGFSCAGHAGQPTPCPRESRVKQI
jgi:hypothetical protein